ncbi:MAG: HNH/ENDO VII family nuclease, partial [Ilumatobacteraceae bacterium]
EDGSRSWVRSASERAGTFAVFNLEVAEVHTYFAAGVLVHNGNDCVGGGASKSGTKIPTDELLAPPSARGRAPTGSDGHPVELHHRDQTPDGPLDEMTRTDHRGAGNFGQNHTNTGQEPSKIDRKAFGKERTEYWEGEWDGGRFDGMSTPEPTSDP